MRLICATLSFVAFTAVNAQHLKFMGIPIDGTINNFQTKLSQKGFSISSYNKSAPIGVRQFVGNFTNKKAQIVVFYNAKTKIVYKVRVAFEEDFDENSDAKNSFNYYKELLTQKYGEYSLNSDMSEETAKEDSYSLLVIQQPIEEDPQLLGIINLSIQEYSFIGLKYNIWIDYDDCKNGAYNENEISNDL